MDIIRKLKGFHNRWVYVALGSLLLGVVIFMAESLVSSNTPDPITVFRYGRIWMPIVMILAVISLISAIVATVKIKDYKKIATILLALLTIPLFLIAGFTWLVSHWT